MKNVGFHGGHTVYECGTSLDMSIFFQCITQFTPVASSNLLIERLHRYYLERESLHVVSEQATQLEARFRKISPSDINWDTIIGDVNLSNLIFDKDNLASVFSEYFKKTHCAIESAASFYDDFQIYVPVKIVISDLPWLIEDKDRPLVQYDALGLNDSPFWLR